MYGLWILSLRRSVRRTQFVAWLSRPQRRKMATSGPATPSPTFVARRCTLCREQGIESHRGVHMGEVDASCVQFGSGEGGEFPPVWLRGERILPSGGKNPPEIYIVIPYSYAIDKSFIAHVSRLQLLFHRAATCKPAPKLVNYLLTYCG